MFDTLRDLGVHRNLRGHIQLSVNGENLEQIGYSCRNVFALDDNWVLKAISNYGSVAYNQSFDEWLHYWLYVKGTDFEGVFAATPGLVALDYSLPGNAEASRVCVVSVQERATARYAPEPRDSERSDLYRMLQNECVWLSDVGTHQLMWCGRRDAYVCVDYGLACSVERTLPGVERMEKLADELRIGEKPLVIGGLDSLATMVNEDRDIDQMSTREMAI